MKEVLLEYGKGLLGIASVIAFFCVLNPWLGADGILSRSIWEFMNLLGG